MTTTQLPDHWRAQAADFMRIAKSYNCAANSGIRNGYVKAAATLKACADELEASMAEAGRATGEAQGSGESGEG